MKPAISGLWPALLTPLCPAAGPDAQRAVAHAHRLLAAGCDGVTLLGTTGEGAAFTLSERKALLESMLGSGIAAQQIIVTITALALGDAIELGRHAARLGVLRQMFMPPFYFKQPSDAGVVAAVSELVRGIDHAPLQLLLYHFPAISSYGFSHAAIAELVRRHPGQVVGIKDSGGDLAHSQQLVRTFPELSVLVGTELQVAAVMQVGGSGSINGLANIAPGLMRRVINAPTSVSAQDQQLMTALLNLLQVPAGLPFVGVYKVLLAEQTGDDFWLSMCAPLCQLDRTQTQSVRAGYRGLGKLLQFI